MYSLMLIGSCIIIFFIFFLNEPTKKSKDGMITSYRWIAFIVIRTQETINCLLFGKNPQQVKIITDRLWAEHLKTVTAYFADIQIDNFYTISNRFLGLLISTVT